MADPMLEGGGLHQSGPGGYLNVHTDFSMHHFHTHWHRRVNLILYLNPGWQEEWGGAIELWERKDGKMARCAAKYPPLLNHALIFTTDERSLHGFPDPLTCPARTVAQESGFVLLHDRTGQESHGTFHRLLCAATGWLGKIGDDLAG